eukprot:TRINITY_DN7834_c0_g1_i3.p1 TRINITY_DN7834_c0_g1~~TRINITY_DN7834_c0_g1_i3.p1  ORF type:complete len:479 (-),score=94.40 TRINITY_DN7834_c0_g1_i3:304-1740(-)
MGVGGPVMRFNLLWCLTALSTPTQPPPPPYSALIPLLPKSFLIDHLAMFFWNRYKNSSYWEEFLQKKMFYNLKEKQEEKSNSKLLKEGDVMKKATWRAIIMKFQHFLAVHKNYPLHYVPIFTGKAHLGTLMAIQGYLNQYHSAKLRVNGIFGGDSCKAMRLWLISEKTSSPVNPTGKWKEPDVRKALLEVLTRWEEKMAFNKVIDSCTINFIQKEELQVKEPLGQGSSAVVYKGIYQGNPVAIKRFSEFSFTFRVEEFYKEANILSALSHPNILQFKGICVELSRDSESVFMLVTEFCSGGSLTNIIGGNPLPYSRIVKFGRQIASAMAYLHSIDVLHRDLKAENILVDSGDNAKIADLGLATILSKSKARLTMMVGTPKWEAPEVFTGKYSTPADVYSFGVLLYEMNTATEPYPEIFDLVELQLAVQNGLRPAIPSDVPSGFSILMNQCWEPNPQNRPTMLEIEIYFRDLEKGTKRT